MELRRLGATGPEISVIGFGAWEAGGIGWGPNPPEDQVLDAIRAGFEAGITWVDTAEIYGGGRSEELIGRAIRDWPDALVFTKVASAPRGTGYRAADIRLAAEGSLRRIGREVIDVYQLHWMDKREAPLEETWGAMAELADAGLVRWVGVSNFDAEGIARCERIRHVDSLQPQLSMLWQERWPLLDLCAGHGTGVVAYAPLAYGLLTGSVRQTRFAEDDWRGGGHGLRAYDQLFRPDRLERNLAVVEALGSVARRVGVSLPRLALAWVLHQKGVTGAIAGSRSPRHVRENAATSGVGLSSQDIAEIEALLQERGEVALP